LSLSAYNTRIWTHQWGSQNAEASCGHVEHVEAFAQSVEVSRGSMD